MKTTKQISIVLAAGVAGAALALIGLSPLVGYVPGTELFAVAVGAGLTLLALTDVNRRIEPLRPRARIERPSIATSAPAWQPSDKAAQRRAA